MSKKYSDLKTPLWTRIAIAVIGFVLVGGTIVGFIAAAAQTQNKAIDPDQIANERAQKQYEDAVKVQKKQMAERQKTLRPLEGFADKVGKFDAGAVTSLTVDTLKSGDGKALDEKSKVVVDYTGWTPDGMIFDSTTAAKSDGSLANESTTLGLDEVIEGWKKGLAGKNSGGVYLLTVPAELAYGSMGDQSGVIKPNTPLKFIVKVDGAK